MIANHFLFCFIDEFGLRVLFEILGRFQRVLENSILALFVVVDPILVQILVNDVLKLALCQDKFHNVRIEFATFLAYVILNELDHFCKKGFFELVGLISF